MNIQRNKWFQRVSSFQGAEHTEWHQQQEVPGLPVFSLWLNVGRKVLFQRLPHLFPHSQASCLARNSQGSGAGISWESTYLLSAEQGMETNCSLGWCTHKTVGHPNVVRFLCSLGTKFLLSLDRQPRVRALSWKLQGHACCAQAS